MFRFDRRRSPAALRAPFFRRSALGVVAAVAFAALAMRMPLAGVGAAAVPANFPSLVMAHAPVERGERTAVLAGGCFWGMEAVFEQLKGVEKVVAGYSGGAAATAHYEMVSTGLTGHAESVQITYDPAVVSYATLLEVYFSVAHDPTEKDRQDPDDGTQYRSSIFYGSDAQRRIASAYVAELAAKHVFAQPIVTAIVPLAAFYPAEDYHQQFARRNPTYPYIVQIDEPKIAALHKRFPRLLAAAS